MSNADRCPLCDEVAGHTYACPTLWRVRRQRRDDTYHEQDSCLVCLFFQRPPQSRLHDNGFCSPPITDGDDAALPAGNKRRLVQSCALCDEFRRQDDSRRDDAPWAHYPMAWLQYTYAAALPEKTEETPR